ncbi:MAG TPA: ABC transporter permease [Pyrinomonadaceae bacterium]|nr:ABC transporter permease [Pyrinomonadaceae bacterium]
MNNLWKDLSYAARMMLRQPGFTIVAILTLALGIGANTAIFSVVNAVLLRPLPFPQPEQLVMLWEVKTERGSGFKGTVSFQNFIDWREQNDSFTDMAAYQSAGYSLQGKDVPERVTGSTVTANFFDLVGIRPTLGRGFQAGEDASGSKRVVILSDALWRRNFGADPEIIDREITLSGRQYTVVGVMPRGFQFPSRSTQLWTPLELTEDQLSNRDNHWLMTLARLKPGVTLEQAQAGMTTIARRIEQQYPEVQTGRGVQLVALHEELVMFARPALLVLLGAVGFVLLIACTNVANLLLARSAARRKEVAIRMALGAGRWRLVRQFLTESVLLFILGGALGLLISRWAVDALTSWAVMFTPRLGEVNVDGRVMGFTLLLSFFTGMIFGLAPAIQSSKTDVQTALKEGGSTGGGTSRSLIRSTLVVLEVAAALVLLVGAGLLIKSFTQLLRTDTGMKPENVITMGLTLPQATYGTNESRAAFYQKMLDNIYARPGVEAAGVINILPIQNTGHNGKIWVEGEPEPGPGREPIAEYRAASPDFFHTLGIPLVEGRYFNAQDRQGAVPVAIVNQTFARRYLPGRAVVVGQRIRKEETGWLTIVGVVRDVRQSGLTQSIMPEVYTSYAQTESSALTQGMTLIVRAAGERSELVSSIRHAVAEVDPSQPVHNVQTMQEVINNSVADRRLTMLLLTIFAGVALFLAMIGIYSVMAYVVTQNTREIGLRMALGAQARDVLKLVVGQGMVLTLVGVGVGLLASLVLTRLIKSLLFGVAATDPLTLLCVSLFLMLVAGLACYIPARRATRIDPMVALRYE